MAKLNERGGDHFWPSADCLLPQAKAAMRTLIFISRIYAHWLLGRSDSERSEDGTGPFASSSALLCEPLKGVESILQGANLRIKRCDAMLRQLARTLPVLASIQRQQLFDLLQRKPGYLRLLYKPEAP